jgi:hypothetical protein
MAASGQQRTFERNVYVVAGESARCPALVNFVWDESGDLQGRSGAAAERKM